MEKIRVKIDADKAIKDIRELTDKLTARQLATGISRAINRTLMEGRTEARKAVKDEYNIPQKNLNGINFKTSTPSTLTGYLYASARPIPMDAFSPKFETPRATISVSRKGQQKVKDRKRKNTNPGIGVSIEVHKGDRQVVPFAFMIRGAKPRVFARGEYRTGAFGFQRRYKRERNDGSDTPIKPLVSVTVHAAVINNKSIRLIHDRVERNFPKNMAHEMEYLVKQLGR